MIRIIVEHGGERKETLVENDSTVANVVESLGVGACVVYRNGTKADRDQVLGEGDSVRISPKGQEGGRK